MAFYKLFHNSKQGHFLYLLGHIIAEKNGCSFYKRVPALGIEENFIKGLAELILKQQTRGNFVSSIMCPNKYVKCPCLEIRV